mmetsp:Transcript_156584/g.380259  ORF Transcript_156584/g.380259 Transcript_156584/m.380259 type:complete len:794 (+) Transcript_156584:75-2456(+)
MAAPRNMREVRSRPGKRQVPYVVFDQNGVLVVYKPPHWTMTTTMEMPRETSIQAWLGDSLGHCYPYLLEEPLQAGLVQRLDVETSGPVVVATRSDTFQRMWQLRSAGHFYREYVALLHGKLPMKHSCGTLEYSLNTRRRSSNVSERHGQPARTRYQAVAAFSRSPGGSGKLSGGPPRDYTLLRVRILTGRLHQIRVHLRELARRLGLAVCGLVGDYKYLPRAELLRDREFCPRVFLHARVLRFPLPGEQRDLCRVSCELPLDLARVLHELTPNDELTAEFTKLGDFLRHEQPGPPAPAVRTVHVNMNASRSRNRSRSPSHWRAGNSPVCESLEEATRGGSEESERDPSEIFFDHDHDSKLHWSSLPQPDQMNSPSPCHWYPPPSPSLSDANGSHRSRSCCSCDGRCSHRSSSSSSSSSNHFSGSVHPASGDQPCDAADGSERQCAASARQAPRQKLRDHKEKKVKDQEKKGKKLKSKKDRDKKEELKDNKKKKKKKAKKHSKDSKDLAKRPRQTSENRNKAAQCCLSIMDQLADDELAALMQTPTAPAQECCNGTSVSIAICEQAFARIDRAESSENVVEYEEHLVLQVTSRSSAADDIDGNQPLNTQLEPGSDDSTAAIMPAPETEGNVDSNDDVGGNADGAAVPAAPSEHDADGVFNAEPDRGTVLSEPLLEDTSRGSTDGGGACLAAPGEGAVDLPESLAISARCANDTGDGALVSSSGANIREASHEDNLDAFEAEPPLESPVPKPGSPSTSGKEAQRGRCRKSRKRAALATLDTVAKRHRDPFGLWSD